MGVPFLRAQKAVYLQSKPYFEVDYLLNYLYLKTDYRKVLINFPFEIVLLCN